MRQHQMDERRKRILDAAACLIRYPGGTDFSLRTLADVAATSPATPYDLFTSKDGLLHALLSRSLDESERRGRAFNAREPRARARSGRQDSRHCSR